MSISDHLANLQQALRGRRLTAEEAARLLGISQPTLSRTVRAAGSQVTVVRQPGVRTPSYALLRSDLPIAARQPLYRIDEQGRLSQIGEVAFLDGGASHVRCEDASHRALNGLHEGLPPFLRTMMPSGFVGRELVRFHHRLLGLPPSLRDWSDDHHVVFLARQGFDTPGDLVLGADAANHALAASDFESLVTDDERGTWYRDSVLAQADQGGGASAGGEQPKFLFSLADGRHLLVKYAPAGSRWADLLACESIALAMLSEQGLPAARAYWFESHGMCYLEVDRFDRVGRHGRRPFVSAGAIDDELFGRRDSWAAFARRCAEAHLLSALDARRIETLAAFGALIGNNDMHFENLGLVPDYARGTYALAPAYDMLPMRYAPAAGGIEPELQPLGFSIGDAAIPLARWSETRPWAAAYWLRVAADARIGAGLRQVAARNAEAVDSHLSRLGAS
jgi:hypothetical protein